MKVFIDTEFSDLHEDFGPNKLISIALVAENEAELYVELADGYYKEDECSEFVIEHVLPYLDRDENSMPAAQAALKIKAWCESLGEQLLITSDAPQHDFEMFFSFLQEQKVKIDCLEPQALHVYHPNLDMFTDMYFEVHTDAIKHHALWDARCLAYLVAST